MWYFILYFFTVLFVIQSIRMLIAESADKKNVLNGMQYVFYIPTAILLAICFCIH